MNVQLLSQGSEDWKAARVGSLGASVVHEVMAKTKSSGYSASRANRMAALVLERLTGKPVEIFETPSMRRGKELEPIARDMYRLLKQVNVEEVGLFQHPTIQGTHASPDGLVGDDGMVEIKAPEAAAHLETLLTKKVPEKYVLQCLWQMRCCGRVWNDYVSYHPDFPEPMQTFIHRIHYDQAKISEMETEISKFLTELDAKVAQLQAQYSEEAV